jgi:hypothetical protein
MYLTRCTFLQGQSYLFIHFFIYSFFHLNFFISKKSLKSN